MNASGTRLPRRGIWVIASCVLACGPAYGWGVPDVLEDPLLSRPPVLDRGAMLPGGAQPIVCPAAVDFKQPLSLADAIDVGLCNNAQIRVAWAAIKVQAAGVGEARAAYLPTASVSASRQHSRTQYPGVPDATSYANGHTVNAGLTWRLFDSGARAANHAAATHSLDAALAGHDAALQKAMSDIISAYFEALATQAALSAREQSALLAKETFESTVRRERRGVAAQSDTLQSTTALANAGLAQQRARSEEQAARATLLYTLGIDPAIPLQLPDSQIESRQYDLGSLERWLDRAAQHPAIVAARAQWEAAVAKVSATRAEGMPTVDATANFYQNGYPNQGVQPVRSNVTTVGLTLTVPLFEGFDRTYKVRAAQAQAEQSEAQLADTTHQVLADVKKAYAAAVAAAGSLRASEDLLRAAQAGDASSRRRYAKGAADILELLSTQSALADAQQQRVRVLADCAANRLKLVTAAGALGEDQILNRGF